MDEGASPQPVKKLKKRPTPHYLASTTASKAMRRPKSNLSNTTQQQQRGINSVPLSMTKPTNPTNMAQTIVAANQPVETSPLASSSSQWIEDIPIEDMKLYFDHFKSNYQEFQALYELTHSILQSMGIVPLKSLVSSNNERCTGGIQTNRFTEFDDDEEQEMMEEGVFSRGAHNNILNMQNPENGSFGKTQGTNLQQEIQNTNEHFETVDKRWHDHPTDVSEIDA